MLRPRATWVAAERDLLGMGWFDAFAPEDREYTNNSWLEAVREQRPHEVEHRIVVPTVEYRWFTTRGVPARDSTGRVFKWFGTCTDITELKELQEDLRRSKGPAGTRGARLESRHLRFRHAGTATS